MISSARERGVRARKFLQRQLAGAFFIFSRQSEVSFPHSGRGEFDRNAA
jgi:hypothetical protein